MLLLQVSNGHRVEVVTNVKGTTIICEKESPDMYQSIDQAASALTRKLRKYKERRTEGWHGGNKSEDFLMQALEALPDDDDTADDVDTDDVDPYAPTITKVHSFDLDKAIPVQEAVFALDYVDHDFYVFRNEENDKITVVYKRHLGDVGLIEP